MLLQIYKSTAAKCAITLILLLSLPSQSSSHFASNRGRYNSVAFSFPCLSFKFEDTTRNQQLTKLTQTLVLSFVVTSALMTYPSTASAASIESGEILFSQNCASCHRNGENVMNPNRDLKKETLLKYFNVDDSINKDQMIGWIEKSGQHKRLFFPNVPGGKLLHEDYENAISFIVDQANNKHW